MDADHPCQPSVAVAAADARVRDNLLRGDKPAEDRVDGDGG